MPKRLAAREPACQLQLRVRGPSDRAWVDEQAVVRCNGSNGQLRERDPALQAEAPEGGGMLEACAARAARKRIGHFLRGLNLLFRACECADAHRMFVRRTHKLARQQGKTPVVWDEVFDLFGGAPSVGDTDGLDPSTVIQQWRWSWRHLARTRAITGAGLRLLWMVCAASRASPPECA